MILSWYMGLESKHKGFWGIRLAKFNSLINWKYLVCWWGFNYRPPHQRCWWELIILLSEMQSRAGKKIAFGMHFRCFWVNSVDLTPCFAAVSFFVAWLILCFLEFFWTYSENLGISAKGVNGKIPFLDFSIDLWLFSRGHNVPPALKLHL